MSVFPNLSIILPKKGKDQSVDDIRITYNIDDENDMVTLKCSKCKTDFCYLGNLYSHTQAINFSSKEYDTIISNFINHICLGVCPLKPKLLKLIEHKTVSEAKPIQIKINHRKYDYKTYNINCNEYNTNNVRINTLVPKSPKRQPLGYLGIGQVSRTNTSPRRSRSRTPPRRSRSRTPPRRSRSRTPPRRSRSRTPPRRNRNNNNNTELLALLSGKF